MDAQSHCTICGAAFEPYQQRQRFCSTACRKAAWRREKRPVGHSGTGETFHALSAAPVAAGNGNKAAFELCRRPGFPPGLTEGRDRDGLPIFFSEDGARLHRIWGPANISELQLRQMRLERTEHAFPGGIFCRSIANGGG